jgi:citrate lyase subunit beta/citryl-CoA lyase
MRLRRSALITPGDRLDLLRKLAAGRQDVAILEMEDGVYETRKEFARQQIAQVLQDLEWGNRERVVRINTLSSPHGPRDIEVIAAGRPDALLLAKTQGPEDVLEASRLLAAAEARAGLPIGGIRLWSMIESVGALLSVEAICNADPRMTAVLFGAGDLGVDLRVKRMGLGSFRRTGWPAYEYAYGRGRVVAAARAAGLDPIDVGHSTFTDEEGTRRTGEFSAQMGFSGIIVYNPRQVPIANEVFSPPPEDIAWAEEVVAKFDRANATEERTVVVVDGEMIDGPFVINARQILERRALIEQVERERWKTSS